MGHIIQLDDRLSNMIAAGEVVERPSSVVKELVENSIDAKATSIEINLIDSGTKSITVIDNGCGMSQDDAKLCFSRHATSKIKNEYDLFRIHTLGFRGEAIPSIASVSSFTLITSDGNDSTKVVYKGGHLKDVSVCPSDIGTTIKVENLFYNVPARLKYLKSLPSELSSISFLVSKFILANPNISFKLTNNDKVIFNTLGNNDLVRVFGELYGLEAAKNVLTKNYEGKGYKLKLTIVKPIVSRSNKLEITTIVNHRYVKSQLIQDAVLDGYHTYLPEHRYPVTLIDLEIDPLLIDVNVHPTKMQIKISNEEELSNLIRTEINKMLEQSRIIPDVKPFEEEKVEEKSYIKQNIFEQLDRQTFKEEPVYIKEQEDLINNKIDELLNNANFKEEKIELKEEKKVIEKKEEKLPYFEYVGQVHGTYLIFQNEEGMYLMDQHAAAERINYEHYFNVLTNPSNESQLLLIPQTIELTSSESILFEEKLDFFLSLGFDITQAFKNSFFIRAIPMWLHDTDTVDFIRNVLLNITQDRQFSIAKYRDSLAKSIACKASIKANHAITMDEINYLVEHLNMCKNPFTCPHGRPTIIKITTLELEKMFKRVM